MCRGDSGGNRPIPAASAAPSMAADQGNKPKWTPVILFLTFLSVDFTVSMVFFSPLIPGLQSIEDTSNHYTLYGSLWDIAILSAIRVMAALYGLLRSYIEDGTKCPFDLYHPNGDRKSTEELEEEALEEPCFPWFKRYTARYAFPCEFISAVTSCFVVVKCLARLDVEVGVFGDAKPNHALFWISLCVAAVASIVESVSLEAVGKVAGKCGRQRREHMRQTGTLTRNSSVASRLGSFLNIPLLSAEASSTVEQHDEEAQNGNETTGGSEEEVRGVSDIAGDSQYKTGWTDLIGMCYADSHLILLAFVFLILAAAAQIYIPKYTGNVLDALAEAYSDDSDKETDIWKIPGFMPNIEKLVVVSLLGGVFSGIRGSIFTIVGGRVNVRLRVLLMDSLLCQDIGFFDTTKTGDITSRLSSDTTLVGDQVSLNVNVFLRSLVQAIGVLIFMFMISWKLSLLAFISVPVITILSKWYGEYIRRLTKLMQKKLADGNCVSEAAIGSMSTVRAFGAECSELKEFEDAMQKYLSLNLRSAVVYVGYMVCYTSLPSLVIALVLFYGGLLVHSTGPDHISSGQLVSFLLYLSSLSDAFNSIGYIFASLTQAIGAADKVFELMHRKPRLTPPSMSERDSLAGQHSRGMVGAATRKTSTHHNHGLHPTTCSGEICLSGVEMYYPARPQRRILNDMNLQVPSGSVVALVGPSGGGKSSIISLIQHLYEPSQGHVLIDGHKVQDLSPEWLSKNVSIVSQEPTLFARSIRRNIIYGLEGTDAEPSMDEIKAAAQMANAASFIEGLPMGYETDVGERGVQLSGGQKQRIAIARALVRKPRVLLLDEATSALDAESEALVQEAIDGMLTKDRSGQEAGSPSMTVIIIAHRLSTVRNADIIYVVESGSVVECGSHDLLVKNDEGAYANLIKRQLKHFE